MSCKFMGDKPCQCHHVGNRLKRAYERVGGFVFHFFQCFYLIQHNAISFNVSILFQNTRLKFIFEQNKRYP